MLRKIYKKILIKTKISSVVGEFRKQGVKIGKNTLLFDCTLDKTHPHLIEIGDNCTLTHSVLLTHDASTKRRLGKSKIGNIIIGDDCFIGWGSIILPGVVIGDNCIIGAGAVVAKDIPSNSVVVGNPCKIIKKTDDYYCSQADLMSKCVCFDYDHHRMTKLEKEKQKEKLDKYKHGFDR